MVNEVGNEKGRIDHLLADGKITASDYQTLIAALEKKPSSARELMRLAINPFVSLSSVNALDVGILSIVILCWIGAICSFQFRGSLDFQVLPDGRAALTPLELALENLVDVLAMAGVFYVGALLSRQKNLRLIDFLSSLFCARFPLAAFALLLFGLGLVFPALRDRHLDVNNTGVTLFFVFAGLGFVAWEIAVIFSALKESSGLRDKALWWNLVIGIIVAETVSQIINRALIH